MEGEVNSPFDSQRPLEGVMDAMDELTGKPAIPFELRDSGGRIHLLSDYGGNWLLLVFHRHLG
ncbi:MAG: hypothetical protein A2X90_10615 [Deltaproteobacteria bacterium GWA2_65_63]|nr:MAG: hypothetical protein A2X90_10615 [Deltaproteobacteria bacterium GWA2_65_63]